MDIERLIAQLMADPTATHVLMEPLADEAAATLVARLKAEADRHYWINANHSLALGDAIVQIGRTRDDPWQIALGLMTRADSLRFLGRIADAWDLFDGAGRLFGQNNDEVGWARTRIGRLLCCVELNAVEIALADAATAREIFERHGEHERLLALFNNTALVHDMLGQYQRALTLYTAALRIAETLSERGKSHLGPLQIDLGVTCFMLGDLHRASGAFEQARACFEERQETRGVALAQHNLGHIAMLRGQYRRALRLLYAARDAYLTERLPIDATHVNRDVIECYLLLNRYTEARDLARSVIAAYQSIDEPYRTGLVLLHLATAEAELGDLEAAHTALHTAEPIFAAINATPLIATTHLRQSQIALRQGDSDTAAREAQMAAAAFAAHEQQIDLATATLLHGRARFVSSDSTIAAQDGRTALEVARRCNIPPLRYAAHLLLGQIAEAEGDSRRARRRYTAAVATVERVQRSLTITLRPGFLEDKAEALRRLLALHLQSGDAGRAFETLERAKSQTWISYLADREQLRWAEHDPGSHALIAELNRLREEHQWFYHLAHDPPGGTPDAERQPAIAATEARAEVAARERRMRAITEELYLHGGDGSAINHIQAPRLGDIRASLDEETLLIEFYNDGTHLWVWTIDRQMVQAHPLPLSVGDLDRLLAQLQVNFVAALRLDSAAPAAGGLSVLAQRILQRLYHALLAPIASQLIGRQRLIIVPFGALHYLPFHLLHNGATYLIEQAEVVILPAAAVMLRRRPIRSGGARLLAHSWRGRLPQTLAEVEMLQRLFGGEAFVEGAARRDVLCSPPTQILHIAAHGEQRLDQPDLSYIQLDDGQLYTDDLLQRDLSYELVTLSACETGRAHVAAGDELIGLGRGFLYAGAGALITSLWPVGDDAALRLMEQTYRSLRSGASKAAALREAQQTMINRDPRLHPACWGAFQLIGDPGPLTSPAMIEERSQRRERALDAVTP